MRIKIVLLLGALCSACNSQPPDNNRELHQSGTDLTCEGLPTLAFEKGFDRKFYAQNESLLRANFARAYCEKPNYTEHPEVTMEGIIFSSGSDTVVTIRNAPDANQTAFYEEDEGNAKLDILEGPFYNESGLLPVPSIAELQEAMFCKIASESVTSQGRCLAD